MRSLLKLVESIFTKLPMKLQIKLYDLILTKIPFFILIRIPCSYSTYLKCYYPQKGDVVVDCGAHIGNCTILFSRLVGRKGRVIAIEPFEESFRVLKGRLRRLKIGNVIPIKKGIWNENVKLSLKAFANTLACSVIENDNRHASYKKNLQIDCATLDYIAKDLNLTRLDIVKMDIEGAEIEAIEGADYIIKMFSPCFAIASYHHRNKKPTYYKIEQILSDKKYSADTFFPPHLTTCGKKTGEIHGKTDEVGYVSIKRNHSVSIVIPSYNSKETIEHCLNSVLNQSYKGRYEVIVVDSSDDGTDRIVAERFPTIKIIHYHEKKFPGAARNIGVRVTDSDYIAFTDADCIVDQHWLENILHRMEDGKYEAIGGVISNGTPTNICGTLAYLSEFSFNLPGTRSGFVDALPTANVCYKRVIFNEYEFFESHFAGEDLIFHWSIVDSGGKVFFDNNVKVSHLNKTQFLNVVKHQLEIGKGAGMARILTKRDIVLIRYPILCILILPFVRLIRMYRRVFLKDKKLWVRISLFFPLSLIIAYSWSLGFLHSVLRNKTVS